VVSCARDERAGPGWRRRAGRGAGSKRRRQDSPVPKAAGCAHAPPLGAEPGTSQRPRRWATTCASGGIIPACPTRNRCPSNAHAAALAHAHVGSWHARALTRAALQAINEVSSSEMFFAALPLVHPRARREFSGRTSRAEPFTRSDLTLHSNVWHSNVIGCLSPWYRMCACMHARSCMGDLMEWRGST
jgi:hypothetical protein